jgi:hypothetical protein
MNKCLQIGFAIGYILLGVALCLAAVTLYVLLVIDPQPQAVVGKTNVVIGTAYSEEERPEDVVEVRHVRDSAGNYQGAILIRRDGLLKRVYASEKGDRCE